MDARYKSMSKATRPRGRNKPLRKKLSQKPRYRGTYTREGFKSGRTPILEDTRTSNNGAFDIPCVGILPVKDKAA